MKQRSVVLLAAGVFCASLLGRSEAKQSKMQNSPRPQAAAASEGEKRFRINCGRCHNSPEDISPREARAVVRHMRVRAMLTAEDERLILAYLAP
jgi:hypothetical protein